MKQYFVYLLTNQSNKVIYVGITNNLIRRIFEHKGKSIKGFTDKYNVNKLVYFEQYNSALDAIEREKQLKAGSRQKKIDLIISKNSRFEDLYPRLLS